MECIRALGLPLTHCQKLGGLGTKQKFILSQVWSPEVQNYVVHKTTFPPKAIGENRSLLLPGFGGLWHPWLMGTSLQFLLLSSHSLILFHLCLLLSFIRTPCHWIQGPSSQSRMASSQLSQFNDTFKDLFSKKGHLHRFQGLGLQHIFLFKSTIWQNS